MSSTISAITIPTPDYPASFHFTNNAYPRSGDVAIGAQLPDVYMAHLARTQAGVNLDVADMSNGSIVDRLIRDNDLEATTAMTITHAADQPILSTWNSYVNLLGTATITFTDDDGQTLTMTTDGEIVLDHTMFVDAARRRGYGQRLGLNPEQIQEMTNLTNPRSVVTYLNDQFEQAPLVTLNMTWKIADII